jgi:alpha-N-arabinofuranosidase
MEEFIREVAEFCAQEKQACKAEHDVYLSFDEWNVWYHFRNEGKEPPKWTVGRPIEEENFDGTDALLVGLMLNSLIRSADVVKIACLAQLVNVIAPIMTTPGGGTRVQTIYYPFLYASRYGRGESLHAEVCGETYDCAIRTNVPYVDCSAVRRAGGEIALFLVNRDPANEQVCTINVAGNDGAALGVGVEPTEWLSLPCTGDAQKGPERMDMKRSMEGRACPVGRAPIEIALPAFSWNMLLLSNKI